MGFVLCGGIWTSQCHLFFSTLFYYLLLLMKLIHNVVNAVLKQNRYNQISFDNHLFLPLAKCTNTHLDMLSHQLAVLVLEAPLCAFITLTVMCQHQWHCIMKIVSPYLMFVLNKDLEIILWQYVALCWYLPHWFSCQIISHTRCLKHLSTVGHSVASAVLLWQDSVVGIHVWVSMVHKCPVMWLH